MRWFRNFLVTLLLGFNFSAIGQSLSDQGQVLLLTCGPGDELYSTFGHTAIWVSDPQLGIDKVYNYGTFDFDTPNFYLKFCQGELDYFLNVTSSERFVASYQYEKRWVKYQLLDLEQVDKNAIFQYLETNSQPDNRSYRYRFLTDNCSTRPRDVFESVLGERLVYPRNEGDTASYRHILDLYLTGHPWSDLGIDIALGKPCDAIPNQRERMFLPDFLMNYVDGATLDGRPLVKTKGDIISDSPHSSIAPNKINWIFWTVFIVAMIASLFLPAKALRWFDVAFFLSVGVIGILIALLWFVTSHAETKMNFNLFWATPTWIYGAWLLIRNRPISRFFKIHSTLMFSIVVFWIFIPQDFHAAAMPIILTLAVRSWAWQKKRFHLKPKST